MDPTAREELIPQRQDHFYTSMLIKVDRFRVLCLVLLLGRGRLMDLLSLS